MARRETDLLDDIGAFAVSHNLDDLLAWWVRNWEYADITGSGQKASLIEALGLVRGDGDTWVRGSVRINGRMWRQTTADGEK